ncbi:MAG TPA: N-acetylmuramoyl-L-alanine amidase [Aliidongia sp.]|uniref:N-acetylmuramoyl-L-alanine amidase family protein n=1 Tax=Aliidongia sp. TaxID=1914230 RepID=UPI002DDCFDB4|nr:N-acetylmuramoyl-L-alanine amidase [Aliidongia sp.]HEV2675574.1 N-acetylmuramoyl-L-alanine amidase [Aliidongia sp.]
MSNDAIGRRELLRVAGLMGLGAFSLALTPEALAQAQARVTRSPAQRRTVVIDAGHGGIDPGCIGYSGTYEKFVAFDAAQEIARLLEATGRFHPVLTRTRDEFIPLQERVVRARAVNGDLFLSIHADSIPDHSLRGASVFTLSEKASDASAAALAAKENHSDVVGGVNMAGQTPEVSNILMDLARRQTNNLSIGLARELVTKLGTEVRMLEHSHRSAGFAVLKAPDIPSALVELGCLSNRDEDKLLRNAAYRRKLADGIVGSVDAYFAHVVRV